MSFDTCRSGSRRDVVLLSTRLWENERHTDCKACLLDCLSRPVLWRTVRTDLDDRRGIRGEVWSQIHKGQQVPRTHRMCIVGRNHQQALRFKHQQEREHQASELTVMTHLTYDMYLDTRGVMFSESRAGILAILKIRKISTHVKQ